MRKNARPIQILYKACFTLALIYMGACIFAAPALAVCASPAGNAGDMTYNQTYNVPTFCDGTNWKAIGPLNSGAGSGGCSNPAGSEGALTYNTTHNVMQYCDGANWVRTAGAAEVVSPCYRTIGQCPSPNSSQKGCFSGRTISWGAVSCSTSGNSYRIDFTAPMVDGQKPSRNGVTEARMAAQYWCGELGYGGWDDAQVSYASETGDSYWGFYSDQHWFARSSTSDTVINSLSCGVNLNAR